MLKIPLTDIVAKIKQQSNLSEKEIEEKIDKKLDQLSGLISREGAAHIIANELGIKLFESSSGKLQIKNILAGMRNVETVGKVQRVFELREFKTEKRSGKVASLVLGDETGTIRVVLWGEQADKISQIVENSIVKVIGGYVRENQGRKEVHLNERSKLIINPEGEKIGEVKQFISVRKQIKDLLEGEESIEILGTLVQVFDPKFFEICPECGKRVNYEGTNFSCPVHGNVNADYSYVLNAFVDDGTENIRCVFFKNQAERLAGMSKEEFLHYKDNPQEFESLKTELLGSIVKLVGRITKNQLFDRLEFTAQLVFTNPNPEEEVKRLEKEKEIVS